MKGNIRLLCVNVLIFVFLKLSKVQVYAACSCKQNQYYQFIPNYLYVCHNCTENLYTSGCCTSEWCCLPGEGWYRDWSLDIGRFIAIQCPQNSYCANNVINQCPANTHSNIKSFLKSHCTANAKYYYDSDTMAIPKPCETGYYCPVDAKNPISCGSNLNSPAMSSNQSNCFANAGYCTKNTSSGVTAEPAEAGYAYPYNGIFCGHSKTQYACEAGTYSDVGQTICTKCPTGTYSTSSINKYYSSCTSCEPGKYSTQEGNNANCSFCEKGKFNYGPGKTSCYNIPSESTNVVSSLKIVYSYSTDYADELFYIRSELRNGCNENFFISKDYYVQSNALILECSSCSTVICTDGNFFPCNNLSSSTSCSPCPAFPPSLSSSAYYVFVPSISQIISCGNWCCKKNYYKTDNANPTCENCLLDAQQLNCTTGSYRIAECLLKNNGSKAYCSPCTPISNANFESSGGINDPNSCAFGCVNYSHYAYRPELKTCDPYNCGLGRKAQVNGNDIICSACPSGYYADSITQAITKTACSQCIGNTYREDTGASNCLSIPSNSRVKSDKTSFLCNYGFQRQENVIYGPSCVPCNRSMPANVAYTALYNNDDPSTACDFEYFFCSSGTYRKYHGRQNFSCSTCPSTYHLQTYSNIFASTSDIQSLLMQKCNSGVPNYSLCTEMDEQNIACYENFRCNNWYYVSEIPSSTSKSVLKTCSPCTNDTCNAGFFQQGCTHPTKINTCSSCSVSLVTNQVFITGSCTPLCNYGYYKSGATCVGCPQGKYKNIISDSFLDCLFCNNGYFSDQIGLQECKACSKGTFSNNSNAMHKTSCDICDKGTFSSGLGSTQCYFCTSGKFQNLKQQSVCENCAGVYSYSTTGSTSCYLPAGIPLCPKGYFKPSSLIFNTFKNYMYTTHINSTQSLTNDEMLCQPCWEGLYCPGNDMALICSKNNPIETYSPILSTDIKNCSVFSLATNLVPCNSPSFVFQQIKCPNNTITWGKTRSKTIFACHPMPGYFGLPGVPPQPCPLDYYCNYNQSIYTNVNNSLGTFPCPSNAKWARAMSYEVSQCSSNMYIPCRPGYYMPIHFNNGSKKQICEGCPQGSYCPGINDDIFLCPSYLNSYSDSPSLSTSLANCITKSSPGPGSCPANTQIPNNGQSFVFHNILQCRALGGYFYIPNVMSQGMLCPVGYYCSFNISSLPIPCPPTPTTCSQGNGYKINPTYCALSGLSVPDPTCVLCPNLPLNAFFTEPGQTCNFCCNIGYFRDTDATTGNTLCSNIPDTTTCAAGEYMPMYNLVPCLTAKSTCQNCLYSVSDFSSGINKALYEGLYDPLNKTVRDALILSVPTNANRFGPNSCHWQCKKGSYYDFQSKICIACPIAKYNDNLWGTFNQTSCKDCSLKTYASAMGSTQCYSCGKWSLPHEDETCLSCSQFSSISASKCISCQSFRISSNPGRQTCNCVNGSISNAYSSSFIAAFTGLTIPNRSCSTCPEGSITAVQGSTRICSSCPAGKLCSINPALTRACTEGYFRPTNNSICIPCLPGTYLNSTLSSATACSSCPEGTYSSQLGSTNCTKCTGNTFSNVRQSTECFLCPTNSASNQNGTLCLCQKHFYLETNIFGSTGTCKQCTFQTCQANASLTACEIGSVSDVSRCICKTGFKGDGLTCTQCSNPNTCVCSINEYQAYV